MSAKKFSLVKHNHMLCTSVGQWYAKHGVKSKKIKILNPQRKHQFTVRACKQGVVSSLQTSDQSSDLTLHFSSVEI